MLLYNYGLIILLSINIEDNCIQTSCCEYIIIFDDISGLVLLTQIQYQKSLNGLSVYRHYGSERVSL
ncbi:hypothetical protein BLNAU_9535 [Blattamonas nauphoetae]|uniref:Uncharacterized protein n=1 Tax=Blattamonas nauphoetae TaxID=2049346 RepID=A0ABQ9XVH5_9EUKA|nr:hypothetical protein BLNAU_9535 [Blattamonas nauphoetae]